MKFLKSDKQVLENKIKILINEISNGIKQKVETYCKANNIDFAKANELQKSEILLSAIKETRISKYFDEKKDNLSHSKSHQLVAKCIAILKQLYTVLNL